MDDARFRATTEVGMSMLSTMVMSKYMPAIKQALNGDVVTYNAYLGGQEVVVLGVIMPDGVGHTKTKAVAILVDDEVFKNLRVDDESGRYTSDGVEPPKVI